MEILVVMAIISLMAGIGLMFIPSESFRLQSEARNIRTALFQARLDAIKTNTNISVRFYSDRYVDSRGAAVDFGSRGFLLTFSGGGQLPKSGYPLTFSPSGTASNSHYHLKSRSGDTMSIRVNSLGRIWLEKV